MKPIVLTYFCLLPLTPWLLAARPKPRVVLQGHNHSISSVVFSPDGKTLASGSSDKTIKLWDAARAKRPLLFGATPK